ncbi:MAG: ComF family protein [Lachnospiraceae bacterium]|nr:ComF family protein [Lachnospiraceae bacterium]
MNIRWLIDAVFPRRCAVCDEVIEGGRLVCDRCAATIRPIRGDTCIKCGKPLKDSERLHCYDCSRKIHYYDRGYAVFEYADIKQSLYRFKYAGRAEYAGFYATMTSEYIGDVLKKLGAEALIPVPIHRTRLAKRGYNQAKEYAKELSKHLDIPVYSKLIIRKKATVPLKKLAENERKNNLKKAFIIASNVVKLKSIIIVDDIYTTGATIDEVARLFKEAGVEHIFFVTVAVGSGL